MNKVSFYRKAIQLIDLKMTQNFCGVFTEVFFFFQGDLI